MRGLDGFPFGLAAQCGVCFVRWLANSQLLAAPPFAHPSALRGQRAGELKGGTPWRERHRHPAMKPPNSRTGAHCAPPAASWIIFQPLPAGSRKPASTLPYRSTGSCVNSTPKSRSRA